MSTAFVLSGGGSLGAVQVGMLQALSERGVRPDLLVGTSAGALNAVIAAYYYLRIVIAMYMQTPEEEPGPAPWLGPETTVALAVAVLAVVALGILPSPILSATRALAGYLS